MKGNTVRNLYQSQYGIVPMEVVHRANDEEAEFLGLGKKARERRKAKKEDKHQKKMEKLALKGSIREKIAAAGGGIGGALKGGFNALLGGLGMGGDAGAGPEMPAADGAAGGTVQSNMQPAQSASMMPLILSVAGIAVVGFVISFFKKKPAQKA